MASESSFFKYTEQTFFDISAFDLRLLGPKVYILAKPQKILNISALDLRLLGPKVYSIAKPQKLLI